MDDVMAIRPGGRAPPPDRATSQQSLSLEPAGKGADRVAGMVARIVYHDEETGFSVIRLRSEQRQGLSTVVGRAAHVAVGEWVEAEGLWRTDPKHGPQFKAEEMRVSAPATRDGIEQFLGSGIVHGIGPSLAKRLVAKFGEAVFDVIENSPERLREISGVGKVKSASISQAWGEKRRIREVMLFLHSHGVGTNRAVRIVQIYGDDTLSILREDPYRLVKDVRGIGFATADSIAKQIGFDSDSPTRIKAGIRQVLRDAQTQGHCGLQRERLYEGALRMLQVEKTKIELQLGELIASAELIQDMVSHLNGSEVSETACVFLERLHHAEQHAAQQLLSLSKGKVPWSSLDPKEAISWAEEELDIEFATSQRAAITKALTSKLLVITGGPGVGKTTLVQAILKILGRKKIAMKLAAPTGRAAKRLSEATGMSARTIHRLLEADAQSGGFKRNTHNPVDCDLLVVDEASMIDVTLLYSLVQAVRPDTALLLIGDVDQLPSVGPGQTLRDMIESRALPVVRLTEIFRQAAESQIVQNAHAVNAGSLPNLTTTQDSDFFFVETRDSDDTQARILKIVAERIPARFGLDPMRDVQVLCPMHRGSVGTQSLNAVLKQTLNPTSNSAPKLSRDGVDFAQGDKVMQVINNYDKDVYNGDVGWVGAIDLEAKTADIKYESRVVRYAIDELDQINLAYAITIHKSQGSEYPAVVIPLLTEHFVMLKRNLLYTAMTRGKQLVVLLGQRRAIEIAVRGSDDLRRTTKLADWLRS